MSKKIKVLKQEMHEMQETLNKALKKIEKLNDEIFTQDMWSMYSLQPFLSTRESKSRIQELEEKLQGWENNDFDDLDRKFDALCELLNIEFVEEKTSNGSENADKKKFFARYIKKTKNK